MVESLPYLYFLPPHPRLLIVGSFPCFNGVDYGDWFYSGSGKNYFWQLLSATFAMPADTRAQKEFLCKENGIALTDVALRIRRKKGNCSDSNLQILEFNRAGLDKCLSAPLRKIFFTSRFVEKHFRALYPDNQLPAELLLSPSPSANRYIGGLEEYKKLVKSKTVATPFDYRLRLYKKNLKFRNN